MLPILFVGLVPREVAPVAGWISDALPFAHAVRLFASALYDVDPWRTVLLEAAWLVVSGLSPDRKFVEMIEYRDHPWFVACQFHPEYKSRPLQPHPLFREFVAAAWRHRRQRREAAQLDRTDAYATS